MLMGVSKAIMENVIFCHQDEALWPFSDQANLKKIFDEIFDTAKYTKILVELRDNSKKLNKKSKDLQQEVEIIFTHF
jgi:DNA repair protein RAD50